MASVIRMPEVLANVTEAAIASWLVTKGQTVAIGAPLAEVETEKAVVEYSAEVEGTVLDLLVAEGDSVAVGDPIAVIGAPGEQPDEDVPPVAAERAATPEPAAAPEPETAPEAAPSPAAGTPAELPSSSTGDDGDPAGGRRFTSPIVRRIARERGVDLAAVPGTGPDGRVVRRDLERFLAAAPAPAPAPASAPAPVPAPTSSGTAYDEVPLTGMRRAIARRLTESTTTIPHFFVVGDVRMDALLDLRAEINGGGDVKVSVNDLLVKAVAGAYRRVPDANATWAETAIRRHRTVDVAIAVAIEGGLVTPVLRDVGARSLGDVATASADLIDRARRGRLKQDELEGGAFSISNLGMFGVTEFSAIINPPQSAILAVGAATERPVVEAGRIEIRRVMTVTLSADHRVIDGALAARWLTAFTDLVEHPMRILL